MSSTNIYILKLVNNNYYVGKTNNVQKRFNEHLNGKGSSWTTIHKPIKIEKVISDASSFDEDKYVKEYMSTYGIDKVRGGTYVTEVLDDIQIYSLQKEIWGAKNLCTKCGRKGHFIKDCYATTDINNIIDDDIIIWICEYCEKEFDDKKLCLNHEETCIKYKKNTKVQQNNCYRCGRSGHYSNKCYARTDEDGAELDSDDDDESCSNDDESCSDDEHD